MVYKFGEIGTVQNTPFLVVQRESDCIPRSVMVFCNLCHALKSEGLASTSCGFTNKSFDTAPEFGGRTRASGRGIVDGKGHQEEANGNRQKKGMGNRHGKGGEKWKEYILDG